MEIVQADRLSIVFILQHQRMYGRLGLISMVVMLRIIIFSLRPHGRDWCMYWGPQVWLKKEALF